MASLYTPYTLSLSPPPAPPRIQLKFRFLRDGEVTSALKILRLFRGHSDIADVQLVFFADGGEYSNTCSVSLAVFLAQGEWLAIGLDDALPRRIRATYLAFSESGTYTFNITSPVDKPEGFSYLAGEFPDGITTRLDTPISATIKVLHTTADGRTGKVAETVSNPDGTWAVHGLDASKKFDVICSLPGFNDLIWSGVSPTTYPYAVILTDNLDLAPDGRTLSGGVTISGGTPPYSLEVLGTPPPGITFDIVDSAIVATGVCTDAGDFSWSFKVTDSADFVATLAVTKGRFIGFFVELITEDSPLFWYRMALTSGTSMADAMGGAGATLSGGAGVGYDLAQPSIADAAPDYSVLFKGSGYAISTAARTLPVANFTLMAVVQINAGAGGATIVTPHSINNPDTTSGSRDRALYVNTSGKLVAPIWTTAVNTIVSAASINDGQPHIIHLACGANAAAGTELYINGVSVGTIPVISLDTSGTRYIEIARSNYTNWPGGSSSTLQGKVDEVAWFNTRLSSTRIAEHAAAAGLLAE